ncbi:MAG: hypothetical protein P1U70_25080, partial [Saprospiraceae bacterium]|nr:hypothetical protein [Saprospiraceae bacterium]
IIGCTFKYLIKHYYEILVLTCHSNIDVAIVFNEIYCKMMHFFSISIFGKHFSINLKLVKE